MTRPIRNHVSLVVDGREVTAPEGTMLVDAAKQGDVEIPVFCYEPKLGEPVGACRMCLVEIEGMPKLQTACSTPVRDGMVVYTQTDRVKEAQNAVVEFLLVNHPLDCPVCDKGGECPLQDIAMGWGPGKSRFTDPQAPLPEAARALAAGGDRPRALHPLLPLRPLQPGGRRGRAAAAARARRQDLRRHLRRAPLHRALPRQHHRALPRRGADLLHLPLPRAALGHRAGRLDLHALPEPVQRRASRSATSGCCGSSPATTPRSTTAGSATRAASPSRCSTRRTGSPGRWSAPATAASARSAGTRRSSGSPTRSGTPARTRPRWSAAAPRTRRAGWSSGSSATAAPPTSTAPRARWTPACSASSPGPSHGARMADLDNADAILVVGVDPLHEMPILDLRIRKAVRRSRAKLMVASERPTALDGGRRRGGPLRARGRGLVRSGAGRRARRRGLRRRRSVQGGGRRDRGDPARRPRPGDHLGRAALARPRGGRGAARLLPGARDAQANRPGPARGPRGVEHAAACARSAACRAPGPGSCPSTAAAAAPRSRTAWPPTSSARSCSSTRTRFAPTRTPTAGARRWRATSSSRSPPSRTSRPGSPNLVIPAETWAEKEGTVTHPGRPPAAPAPERPAARGHDPRLALPRRGRRRSSAPASSAEAPADVFDALADEVPFYDGLTYEEIGGTGVRWGDRAPGQSWTPPAAGAPASTSRAATASGRRRRAAARHLPRPLGRGRHQAESGAALPDAEAEARAGGQGRRGPRAGERRRGHRLGQRPQRRGDRRDPRADARGRRLPDRGDRRGATATCSPTASRRGSRWRSDEPAACSPRSTTSRRPG